VFDLVLRESDNDNVSISSQI